MYDFGSHFACEVNYFFGQFYGSHSGVLGILWVVPSFICNFRLNSQLYCIQGVSCCVYLDLCTNFETRFKIILTATWSNIFFKVILYTKKSQYEILVDLNNCHGTSYVSGLQTVL